LYNSRFFCHNNFVPVIKKNSNKQYQKQKIMSLQFEQFKSLHYADNLFVLPNAWNAKSALLLEQQGFPAIATSSAAVAESLGYGDGEQMLFEEYLAVIKRIISVIHVPLTVDIETGYGKTDNDIFVNIKKLAGLGVAGINIEDSIITKTGRVLKDAKAFANTIEFIKNKFESDHSKLFINIRCDTYILNVDNKQQETNHRLKIYASTGADGIFLPGIADENDIAEAVHNTKLPINVMCIPCLPGFDVLNKLGVKRVSMGPFMFTKVYREIASLSQLIIKNNNFSALLS